MADLEPAAASRPEDLDLQLALVDAYTQLAEVREELGRPERGLELRRKRLAVVEALARSRPTSSVVRRNRVAAAQGGRDDLSAIWAGMRRPWRSSREAVATAEALVADNPTSIPALKALAACRTPSASQQFGLGRVADALASMEAAGRHAGPDCGARSPQTSRPAATWPAPSTTSATFGVERGDNAGALAAYEESLAMRLALDREHPDDPRFAFDAATTLGNIGRIYTTAASPRAAATPSPAPSNCSSGSWRRIPRTPTTGASWRGTAATWRRP